MEYIINDIQWKDICINGEFSGYLISDDGMVFSTKNKILLSPNKARYYLIQLHINGIIYPRLIHRLVAEAFVNNPDPENKTQVNHIDGNKQNNHYTNLEWVTAKENKKHAIETGLDNPKHGNQLKGSESGVSKYNEVQAHEVCKLLEKGLSNKEISKSISVNTEFVRSIKRGIAWTHISKDYTLPKSEKRNYYSKDFRQRIQRLIDKGLKDIDIAITVGLPNPTMYGRSYVNKIRSRYIDKTSTTIPEGSTLEA